MAKVIKHKQRKSMEKKPSGKERKKQKRVVWIKNKQIAFQRELSTLQIELMKLQLHMRKHGMRIVALFEGREASGKAAVIKRFTEHLNPRYVRVVSLPKPNDTEKTQWYFQRYVSSLPAAGELVFFNRSWYNRAMVEPVMGYCSEEQRKRFLIDVPLFEKLIAKDGIILFKFYLSISKTVQHLRLKQRSKDPLNQSKFTEVAASSQSYWKRYSLRKYEMLASTDRLQAPWTIIRANDQHSAQLNCMKFLLYNLDYSDKATCNTLETDPSIVVTGIDELQKIRQLLI